MKTLLIGSGNVTLFEMICSSVFSYTLIFLTSSSPRIFLPFLKKFEVFCLVSSLNSPKAGVSLKDLRKPESFFPIDEQLLMRGWNIFRVSFFFISLFSVSLELEMLIEFSVFSWIGCRFGKGRVSSFLSLFSESRLTTLISLVVFTSSFSSRRSKRIEDGFFKVSTTGILDSSPLEVKYESEAS
jgi:hypothetical protein